MEREQIIKKGDFFEIQIIVFQKNILVERSPRGGKKRHFFTRRLRDATLASCMAEKSTAQAKNGFLGPSISPLQYVQ
jgi:hypothetical protein